MAAWYHKARNLIDKVMQGPTEPAGGQSPVATMATGERRGFKPGVPHPEVEKATQSQVFPPVSDAQQNAQAETGKKRNLFRDWLFPESEMEKTVPQDAVQPTDDYYQSRQTPVVDPNMGTAAQGGYQQAMPNQPYGQTSFTQGGYQQAVPNQPYGQTSFTQGGYQQAMPNQPYGQTSFTQGGYQQPLQGMGYNQGAFQAQNDGNGFGGYQTDYQPQQPVGSQDQQRRSRRSRAEQGAQEQRNDNVLYMNQNNFVDENGVAYSMMMHLARPSRTANCYRLIDFMRNGEILLINLEEIHDKQECSRCLDLLFGAAYAMNCTYTRVADRCIYLVAPRQVGILPYRSMDGMGKNDRASRWPNAYPEDSVNQERENPRERRGAWNDNASVASAGYERGARAGQGRYY